VKTSRTKANERGDIHPSSIQASGEKSRLFFIDTDDFAWLDRRKEWLDVVI
jgi:hypothetical protein